MSEVVQKSVSSDFVTSFLDRVILESGLIVEDSDTASYSEWDAIKPPSPSEAPDKAHSGVFRLNLDRTRKYIDRCTARLDCQRHSNAMVMTGQTKMDWHTNSDDEGLRIYYTFCPLGGGFFRYVDSNGEIVTLQDFKGWTRREFYLRGPEDPLLHTIYAPFIRYSFGFKKEN